MRRFVRDWRDIETLTAVQNDSMSSREQFQQNENLPVIMREFYSQFTHWIQLGFFEDQETQLFNFDHIYFREHPDQASSRILCIAADRWGSLWGIKEKDFRETDPSLLCINADAQSYENAFGTLEFLAGLLFRSTLIHTPIQIVLGLYPKQWKLACEVHEQLCTHFPTWEKSPNGEDFGFLSHIESEELIAALSSESLTIGLKNKHSLERLPLSIQKLLISLIQL